VNLYKQVDFEKEPCVFVGVHCLQWHHHPDQPTVGFVEVELDDIPEVKDMRQAMSNYQASFAQALKQEKELILARSEVVSQQRYIEELEREMTVAKRRDTEQLAEIERLKAILNKPETAMLTAKNRMAELVCRIQEINQQMLDDLAETAHHRETECDT
jgi:predicted  nucleic acid-binding Zn-ribbon protein